MTVALASCTHTRDCVDPIPQELRADTIRLVLDRRMLGRDMVPRLDLELARDHGTPLEEMSKERQREVSRYVVSYSHCIKERLRTR